VFVKNLNQCQEFTANDGCQIREWLHPKNDPVTLPYSIAEARVEIGKSSYKHQLKQTEIYIIQQGQGDMYIDEVKREVCEGDIVHIPAESTQWIKNTGQLELIFLAIVSPPWREEDDSRL
jgi:mannose-6-phosphate isomerase-like protein (cupin superfamily)